MEKQKRDILMLIRKKEDVFSAFVTLASISKHLKSISFYQIRLFSLLEWGAEVKAEFSNLCGDITIDFQTIDNKIAPQHRLDLLCYVLQNFSFANQVLYLSSSALVLEDIDELFKNKKEPLLARKDKEGFIDTHVMLFNHKKWCELFKKHSVWEGAFTSADVMGGVKELDLYHNYPVSQFNLLIDRKKVKILRYDTEKPWESLEVPFGPLWWKYLRGSNFYDDVLSEYLSIQKSGRVVKNNPIQEIAQKDPEKLYLLAKEFLKEKILCLLMFGERAKKHKENLKVLHQRIIERADL